MGTKIDRACELAVQIANDPACGYSQRQRWGPDYDCSSLVITCYERAGVPVKSRGATYTGNMRAVFSVCGFEVLDHYDPAELVKGDVLLNDQYHTALYIGDGKLVEATGSETGGIDGQTGDQTGGEIRITPVYTYFRGWPHVLRLHEDGGHGIPVEVDHEDIGYNYCKWDAVMMPEVGVGHFGPMAASVEAALNYHGFGYLAVDGHISYIDAAAIKRFQTVHHLEPDGVVGPKTWHELTRWN